VETSDELRSNDPAMETNKTDMYHQWKVLQTPYASHLIIPALVDDVASHLQAASIVHFACHGKLRYTALNISSLSISQLDLNHMTRLSLPNARLVFLFACHIAMMGHMFLIRFTTLFLIRTLTSHQLHMHSIWPSPNCMQRVAHSNAGYPSFMWVCEVLWNVFRLFRKFMS
jgi:CHAT domain